MLKRLYLLLIVGRQKRKLIHSRFWQKYVLFPMVGFGLLSYAFNFFVGLFGALGWLSPWYVPYSFWLEFRRLSIEYWVLGLFPLWFFLGELRVGFSWVWGWRFWVVPMMCLVGLSVFCYLVGGVAFTPYIPFPWSNVAVFSHSVSFVVLLYCFRGLKPLDGFVGSCASVVVASWLYEFFDMRMLGRFPDYVLLTQAWLMGVFLLLLLAQKSQVEIRFSKWLLFGLFCYVASQVPYLVYNPSVVGPSSILFWQVWDTFVRILSLPFFVAVARMFVSSTHKSYTFYD